MQRSPLFSNNRKNALIPKSNIHSSYFFYHHYSSSFHSDGLSHTYMDTIGMELSILYFKGLPVKISIRLCISVPQDCFYLTL